MRRYGERHEVTYEPVGGINPKDGPVALCVGGVNRLTGQLVEGFWGSSCDADEREMGGFFDKAVLPTAMLAKAHMPDLAQVVPAFNVESIEGTEAVQQRFSRKVEFESLDFNKRFWTTVPKDFDPIALRELFGPGFLAWVTTMTGEIRLRRQRPPAVVHLAPARALRGRTETGAEKRRAAVPTAAVGDGRERHPHLSARALARRPGAVPRRARGRFLAARPELGLSAYARASLAELAQRIETRRARGGRSARPRPRRPRSGISGSVERPR